MMTRAAEDAIMMVMRGCFMAMIAAIKNVLSPISDTKITQNEVKNAWSRGEELIEGGESLKAKSDESLVKVSELSGDAVVVVV